MLDIIKHFFGNGGRENGADTQGRDGHGLQVAICALFLEIGRIDETFTDAEMETLLSILKERYGLSKEHADALIREADRELDNSVDYWQFANLINKNYSIEEKIDIVETLWRIVFVDGRMDKYEHYLMNKLGNLLRLTHAQLMDAKMKVLHASDQPQKN